MPARSLLANTDDPVEEAVQANFFSDVRRFYCAVVRKMMKIFDEEDKDATRTDTVPPRWHK